MENKEFLQSEQWREFQQAVGRKTHFIENDGFSASIIEHKLPMVGKYLYIPRGPILKISNLKSKISTGMQDLIDLTKKENAGWIRIEPEDEEALKLIKENISEKIVKAPHDMQPKEVFVLDISKSEEQLLSEMKPKTRYNIKLAEKKGVTIVESRKYVEEFLKLTREMAQRQGITAHPEEYYRKMIETLPEDMLKIYSAEFEGKIIASSLVIFFGETATYAHGASSNENRNVMAPFLIQWQAILDAKEKGYVRYDFGGVKTSSSDNSWTGITQFKLGFSPSIKPIVFPGTYDIIVNPRKYAVYRGLQRAKALLYKIKK